VVAVVVIPVAEVAATDANSNWIILSKAVNKTKTVISFSPGLSVNRRAAGLYGSSGFITHAEA
jgi:hypothetical protein